MDADARFEALQRRLVALWPTIRTWSDDEQTVIVVPSYSLDPEILRRYSGLLAAYEERFLYLLFLLRQPRCRVVFVSSQAIPATIVDAYLALVPGTTGAEARSRVDFVACDDPSPRALAAKVLASASLLERIRALVTTERVHLVCFNVTQTERDLALALDVPIYGAAPRHGSLGSKTGCRRLFAEVGIPAPDGEVDLGDEASVAGAVCRVLDAGARAAVIKLNEGVSGLGNVVLPDAGLRRADGSADGAAVADAVARLDAGYRAEIRGQGAVVEELLEAHEIVSPSVQLRVAPDGAVELLSTHDQILGGASGQTYIGCRFPADPAYAPGICADALRVGERLATEGVTGRFAVDFVVLRDPGEPWRRFAIEVNLRKGGTTHPFLTAQYLTDGVYDADSSAFVIPGGERRCYVATDGLAVEGPAGPSPEDVLDGARRTGLAYDHATRRGVVFHMLGALAAEGRVGLTAIGVSPQDADDLYARAAGLLAGLAAGDPVRG